MMDFKGLLALVAAAGGLIGWGVSVEVRFARVAQIECVLRQQTVAINWVGNAVSAASRRAPIPDRPVILEAQCED